jgi:hypothetical protein
MNSVNIEIAAAILLCVTVLLFMSWGLKNIRENRRAHRLYQEAKRTQFINNAAIYHGYKPYGEAPQRSNQRMLSMVDLTEEIPKALHAMHRMAAEERRLGRKHD